jgi:predicted DNA-binding transcriptional regulator AlpA
MQYALGGITVRSSGRIRGICPVTRVRGAFPPNYPAALEPPLPEAPRTSTQRGTTVNSTLPISDDNVSAAPRAKVTLSPWVNEPLPPFQELLSAHDVARLTRRPRLVISGLVLLRRFPKKRRYRGRQIGWLRAEVIDWMTRDMTTGDEHEKFQPVPRRCARARPHQPCLPLDCTSPCVPERRRVAFSTPASALHEKQNRGRGR